MAEIYILMEFYNYSLSDYIVQKRIEMTVLWVLETVLVVAHKVFVEIGLWSTCICGFTIKLATCNISFRPISSDGYGYLKASPLKTRNFAWCDAFYVL